MKPALALARKEIAVALRSPLYALVSALVPVAFTLLYAIVVHVSTTATIAVADESHSAASSRLLAVMRGLHNDDGRYYEVLTTDPEDARRMYGDGAVGSVLTIPEGFADPRSASEPVRLEVFNINADGTKNQHLRLEQTLRTFDRRRAADAVRLRLRETPVLGRDIPITVYLGTALLVFSALYAGLMNVGTAVAREWEERTAKELMLAPAPPLALVVGKWLGSGVVSVMTVSAAALGITGVLGLPPARLGVGSLFVLALFWLYGAALGTLLGVLLRRSLPLVPMAVILAVVHFLLFGYESYVRGFAHGGAVGALWQTTHWVPLSTLFDVVRFEVTGLGLPPDAVGAALWSLAGVAVLTVVAVRRLGRTVRFAQGQ